MSLYQLNAKKLIQMEFSSKLFTKMIKTCDKS